MSERNITVDEVNQALNATELIELRPSEVPPSSLLLGYAGTRALHIVCADDHTTQTTLIKTLYEPDLLKWEADFKTRR